MKRSEVEEEFCMDPLPRQTPQEEAMLAAQEVANEIALGGKPELIKLWKQIIEDYINESNHDQFISACFQANALGYAAHKYNRILKEFPAEEKALRMRRRIIHLVSMPSPTVTSASASTSTPTTASTHSPLASAVVSVPHLQSASDAQTSKNIAVTGTSTLSSSTLSSSTSAVTMPMTNAVTATTTSSFLRRMVFSLTSLSLLVGVIVFCLGMWIPGLENLMRVGGALVALILGLHFFSRRDTIG